MSRFGDFDIQPQLTRASVFSVTGAFVGFSLTIYGGSLAGLSTRGMGWWTVRRRKKNDWEGSSVMKFLEWCSYGCVALAKWIGFVR